MAGGSTMALDHPGSALNQFLSERPLTGPAAGQIAQAVTRGRKCPLRGCGLFDHHRLFFPVLNACGSGENAALRIDGIAQRDINLAGNIFQQYFD